MDFGEELRRRRIASGLSLRELAVRVHYSRGYLSKVETRQAPASIELARLCDAALRAGGALIALAQPRPRAQAEGELAGETWTVTMDPGAGSWFTTAHTRGPGGGPTGGVRLAVSVPRPAGGSPSDQATVEAFRAWFRQLRALGQQVSPGVLLPMLIAQTHTLRQLAAAARDADKRTLLRLASHYAEYAGWMSQEAGDDRAALWWTDQATNFAIVAGDPVMGSYALVRHALISLYSNDPAQAISLGQRAQSDARAPARVRGLAALHEAQGHALAGGYDDCHRALERARRHLAQHDDEPDAPILGTSTVVDPASMVAGWCLHDLGRPGDATPILNEEIARLPSYAYRSRARFATRRALAYATAGELDHACEVTHQLLPEARVVASATIRIDLHRLARALGRWPRHHAVLQLQPHLDSALAGGRQFT